MLTRTYRVSGGERVVRRARAFLLVFAITLAAFSAGAPHALAAISFVGSAESSSSPNADTTVDLSTISGLTENDLVIVAASVGDDDGAAFDITNNTAGYTKITQLFSNDTDDTYLAVWWKFMEATPDSSVQIEGSNVGGIDSSLAVVVMVFRGVDRVTPFDVASTTATGIDSPNPDPPSIDHNNPSGIWTVIAGANSHIAGGACTFTFPTGYTTDAIDRGHDDTNDTTIGMGYRSSGVSDPEDPGVMTHSCTSNTSNSWAAVTMALRPQTGSAPTVVTGYASNVDATTALLNGTITSDGGQSITTYGFATSTSATLSTGVSTSSFGSITAPVAVATTSKAHSADTTYYFRFYATNVVGTSYGDIHSFTTGNTGVTRRMRLFEGYRIIVQQSRVVTTFLTSGTSYVVPLDWNNNRNSIEVIGGGGGGKSDKAVGAGGGAYSKVINQTLTPGATVTYSVGAGGTAGTSPTDGGDTYFCNSTSNCTSIADTAVIVGAKGGQAGAACGSSARAGGSSASGVGSTKYSGGNGGTASCAGDSGGGGGGAAGPSGAGNNGANSGGSPSTPGAGGSGGAGAGGIGGAASTGAGDPGDDGGAGTEFDSTRGSGGGGGGAWGNTSCTGGCGGGGGLYGGGAGGDGGAASGARAGGQGIIVIQYQAPASNRIIIRPR